MNCSSCGAPYHEATGHRYSDTSVICGACARSVVHWLRGMLARKFRAGPKGKPTGHYSFYDAASKWKFWNDDKKKDGDE